MQNLDNQFRFRSRIALYFISVLALAAAVVSILSLEHSMTLPAGQAVPLILEICFTVLFVTVVMYALNAAKGSGMFFKIMLASYAVIAAVAAVEHGGVMPLVSGFIELMAVIWFYLNWKRFGTAKFVVLAVAVLDIALTVVLCLQNGLFQKEDIYRDCDILLRPVASVCIAASYFARMREKLKDETIK